ncbi:MAG: hypothetical protein ACI9BH_003500, partial [Paracoccaceae bacterium]
MRQSFVTFGELFGSAPCDVKGTVFPLLFHGNPLLPKDKILSNWSIKSAKLSLICPIVAENVQCWPHLQPNDRNQAAV